jgi:hypothetical protein
MGTSMSQTLWASTACYGDGLIFSYVDDVRTLQETHVRASTACYANSFTFYVQIMLAPHRKHTHTPSRPTTRVAVHFYM